MRYVNKDMLLDDIAAPSGLTLPDVLRGEILKHLQASAPFEGVGLLATATDSLDGAVIGTRFYAGRNQDRSATRYTMPPEEVLAALQDMEANGWRLGAIVHSHPVGPATPSATDLREYRYPDALMVIVSLGGRRPDLRAWWLGGGGSTGPMEVPVVGGVGHAPAPGQEEK